MLRSLACRPDCPDIGSRAFALGYLLLGPCLWGVATAGGLSIPTYCVQCQGSGNAGAPARADSPATVFSNPAGLTRLSGTRAELGLHAVRLDVDLRQGAASGPLGNTMSGPTKTDGGALVWPANVYISHTGDGRWGLGLGVSTPFGLTTDYDRNWPGRYHALRSELSAVDIGPAAAYRVNPWLSLGAGIDLVYVSTELTNAVDLGSLLTAQLGGPIPTLGITPGNPAVEGHTRLEGNDWGLGWNLGLLLEPTAETRIGLSVRSKVDLDLDGSAKTLVPASITALTGGQVSSTDRDASARLTLPPTLRLGLWQAMGARWGLMLGAQWTGWHTFDATRVRFSDGGAALVEDHDWNDVWRYSLGVEYRHSDRLTLRAGLEYDETPIPKINRSMRIPGRDQRWLSLGFSFKSSPAITWDLAYSHVLVGDYRVDLTEVTTPWASEGLLTGNRLVGDMSTGADVLSLGLRLAY